MATHCVTQITVGFDPTRTPVGVGVSPLAGENTFSC